MVVPPPGVRELLGGRDLLDLLEDLDVGLRRGVAVGRQTMTLPEGEQMIVVARDRSELRQALWFCIQIAGS